MFDFKPKKEIFIPDKCKSCRYYTEDKFKVLGIRIQTPFSYILARGCVSDIPCNVKNVQTLFFGVGVNEADLRGELWGLLGGHEELDDKDELIRWIENFSGFNLNNLEKLEPVIPPVVERFAKTIIECEIPCGFNYPLVGWKNVVGIDIDPVTEELVPVRPVKETHPLRGFFSSLKKGEGGFSSPSEFLIIPLFPFF